MCERSQYFYESLKEKPQGRQAVNLGISLEEEEGYEEEEVMLLALNQCRDQPHSRRKNFRERIR